MHFYKLKDHSTFSVADWQHSTNSKSILGVKQRQGHWLVLGWVTIWGVEVLVKLRTLEPRSMTAETLKPGKSGFVKLF